MEGAPCVVKPGVSKEEAEEIKKKLEEGSICSLQNDIPTVTLLLLLTGERLRLGKPFQVVPSVLSPLLYFLEVFLSPLTDLCLTRPV